MSQGAARQGSAGLGLARLGAASRGAAGHGKGGSRGSIRRELHRLADLYGGSVTPAQVVSAASDPDSPLRGSFQWDNEIAGREYRLWQARAMLNRYQITYIKPNGTPNTVREFHSIRSAGQRAYVPVTRVIRRQAMLHQVIAEFDRLLAHFAARVEAHSDLFLKARYRRVLDAINETIAERVEA